MKISKRLQERIEKSKKAIILAADMSRVWYNAPLAFAYSGGKDSDVMIHLARQVLKPEEMEVYNSHTTLDAPETVYHIREVIAELNGGGIKAFIKYPTDKDGNPTTIWKLIVKKKMPPTRMMRYCCQVLKEEGIPNRLVALGVRAAESAKRAGRDIFGVRGGTYKEAIFFFT